MFNTEFGFWRTIIRIARLNVASRTTALAIIALMLVFLAAFLDERWLASKELETACSVKFQSISSDIVSVRYDIASILDGALMSKRPSPVSCQGYESLGIESKRACLAYLEDIKSYVERDCEDKIRDMEGGATEEEYRSMREKYKVLAAIPASLVLVFFWFTINLDRINGKLDKSSNRKKTYLKDKK